MKIGILTVIYIRTKGSFEYAMDSIKSFHSDKHELVNIGVVNACDESYLKQLRPYYDHIIMNDVNILSRAWNKGIAYLSKDKSIDYMLMPNLDVVLAGDTIDKLVESAIAVPDAIAWVATACRKMSELNIKPVREYYSFVPDNYSFSCYMINRNLPKIVGKFDEKFIPAYFEDMDMKDRVHASGNFIVRDPYAKFFHHTNGTRKQDGEAAMVVRQNHPKNEAYYLQKRKILLGF